MDIICNGQRYAAGAPLFASTNRGFRYGDGLFETIKVAAGEPLLWPLHWARLQQGMQLLQLNDGLPAAEELLRQVRALCTSNGCAEAARVRLAVYRTEEGSAGYVLEADPLARDVFSLNSIGWKLAVYRDGCKAVDAFSNIKSANYLLYAMASRYAAANDCDEALVCNSSGNVADGGRTNIFVWKAGVLLTPALAEGCVAGVLRRYLIDHCHKQGIACVETAVKLDDLENAEEILLTNAVQGIRWVGQFNARILGNQLATQLYRDALATIYPQHCYSAPEAR